MDTIGSGGLSAMADDNKYVVHSLLSELGSAYRGDWSEMYGRTLRMELGHIAGLLISDTPIDLNSERDWLRICPKGMGHWEMYCKDYDCYE